MSSVGPTDGGYQYYSKSLGDLEDELKEDTRRNRVKDEESLAKTERNYRDTLSREREKMENTVNNIKESAREDVASERANANAEVQRLRKETYNRLGKSNGLEAETLKDQLDRSQDAFEIQKQDYQRKVADVQDSYAKRFEHLEKVQAQKVEDSIDRSRRQLADASEQSSSASKSNMAAYKEELDQKYTDLSRRHMDDQNYQRRQAQAAVEDIELDYKNQLDHAKSQSDDRTEKALRSEMKRQESSTRTLRDSHADETAQLRTQVKNHLSGEREDEKRRIADRAAQDQRDQAIQRRNDKNLVESYEDALDHERYTHNLAEKHMAQQNDSAIKGKEDYYASLISEKELELYNTRKDLEREFERGLEQKELSNERDREASDEHLEKAMERANESREEALTKQAKAYREQIARNHVNHTDETQQLQKELRKHRSATDIGEITPATENIVRKSVVKEYEKTLATEQERNERKFDSLHREYSGRLQEQVEGRSDDKSKLSRDFNTQAATDRREMLVAIDEAQYAKDTTLREQAYAHERENEAFQRNTANVLERQRRSYEEVIDNLRNDAQAKIQTQRQENEFNSRMASRAFAAKQNEVIREYEKRLTDLKADLDAQKEEMKVQASRDKYEMERRAKMGLEEQARSYEQKIAQMEFQAKERERYLTQNYEETLEKTKRSNAQRKLT